MKVGWDGAAQNSRISEGRFFRFHSHFKSTEFHCPLSPKSFAATLPSFIVCNHANDSGERGHISAIRPEQIQDKPECSVFNTFCSAQGWDQRASQAPAHHVCNSLNAAQHLSSRIRENSEFSGTTVGSLMTSTTENQQRFSATRILCGFVSLCEIRFHHFHLNRNNLLFSVSPSLIFLPHLPSLLFAPCSTP